MPPATAKCSALESRFCIAWSTQSADHGPSLSRAGTEPSVITRVLLGEEERFLNTLHQGLRELDTLIEEHQADGTRRIAGDEAFRLYDTFGFPIDLAEEVAQDAGMQLDRGGFEAVLEATRQQARETWKGSGEIQVAPVYPAILQRAGASGFLGYDLTESTSPLVAILVQGQEVPTATTGQPVELVFAHTPFYGEAGGQSAIMDGSGAGAWGGGGNYRYPKTAP